MPRPYRIIPPLSVQDKKRFWKKVDVRGPNDCWPWIASKNADNYGRFVLGSQKDGSDKIFRAHRSALLAATATVRVHIQSALRAASVKVLPNSPTKRCEQSVRHTRKGAQPSRLWRANTR